MSDYRYLQYEHTYGKMLRSEVGAMYARQSKTPYICVGDDVQLVADEFCIISSHLEAGYFICHPKDFAVAPFRLPLLEVMNWYSEKEYGESNIFAKLAFDSVTGRYREADMTFEIMKLMDKYASKGTNKSYLPADFIKGDVTDIRTVIYSSELDGSNKTYYKPLFKELYGGDYKIQSHKDTMYWSESMILLKEHCIRTEIEVALNYSDAIFPYYSLKRIK